MAATPIFDRIDIIESLKSAYLGTRGESGVLICSHKSGKSFLLDHIYEAPAHPDLIMCRVNADLMRAEHGGSTGPLDQTFLRHFVRRLHLELERSLEESQHGETLLTSQLRDAREQLLQSPAATPYEVERRNLIAQTVAALEAQERQLLAVKSIVTRAAKLLDKPEIAISEVASLVERLRISRKRIVLLIDDYHRIVREGTFDKSLFNFLRGASSEGTIITLASATTSLMHDSLHADDPGRIALFNHFRGKVLHPFTRDQADQFLDWLPPQVMLTGDEKSYLYGLCGGSPYFLRTAREEFLAQSRPASETGREQFERDMGRNLSGALRDLMTRCSSTRRAILRDIANGKPVAASPDLRELVDDGYVVEVIGGRRISSRIFDLYIRSQPEEDEADGVEASISIPHQVFPTALAYAVPQLPVIVFHLHNPTDSRVKLSVRCELKGLSDRNLQRHELKAGERRTIELPVVLQWHTVDQLVSPRPVSLEYEVLVLGQQREIPILSKTQALTVMPNNYFTFGRLNADRGLLMDSTWSIAAWITTNDVDLGDVRKDARRRNNNSFAGYRGSKPEQVRSMVEAIYNALKTHGMDYDNSPLVFHRSPTEYTQRVRLPAQVLKNKGGNCLEGCVLFASLLSACALHPLILFVPGHALVGWKESDSEFAPWQFLETTVISTASFVKACNDGQAQYEKVRALCDSWVGQRRKELRRDEDFAIPVDIHREITNRRLPTLPSPAA